VTFEGRVFNLSRGPRSRNNCNKN